MPFSFFCRRIEDRTLCCESVEGWFFSVCVRHPECMKLSVIQGKGLSCDLGPMPICDRRQSSKSAKTFHSIPDRLGQGQ